MRWTHRSIAKHRRGEGGGRRRKGAARDEPIGVRLKYKMGFEDSDGVTRRFNYCRPGATYNFCHRPIAAFHLLPSPRSRPSRCSIFPPCLRSSLDFFSRERRFFSALLPEPQNGAKMRYRFAEPGLAADRSADLVRARVPCPLSAHPSFHPLRSVDERRRPASAFFPPHFNPLLSR